MSATGVESDQEAARVTGAAAPLHRVNVLRLVQDLHR
jgi:hypothetical protein